MSETQDGLLRSWLDHLEKHCEGGYLQCKCYEHGVQVEPEHLRALLAELEWRPIAEAPRDGTHILLWWPSQRPIVGTACVVGRWGHALPLQPDDWWASNGPVFRGAGDTGPMYWMPIPESPRATA